MRREVARRASLLMLLLLLTPLAPPLARAQESPPADAAILSLQDCIKAALENNLDIAVARYDPLKSETAVTSQHAAFDPSITGSTSSNRDESRRSQEISGTNFDFPSSTKSHSFDIGFEDPLIIGGRYRLEVRASDDRTLGTGFDRTTFTTFQFDSTGFNTSWLATYTQSLLRNLGPNVNRWQIVVARNNLAQSESQFRQTVMDTLSSAEKAYWDLNFALMDLKTQRASLQLAKDFLEQNRIKVRVGTLAPIEITQAEAGVADREEGVILAENAVRTAEDALRRIMNVPAGSPLWSQPIQPAETPPLTEVTAEMDAAVAAAETSRPDLEQGRLSLKSRETEVAHYRNQKRWDLQFDGSYGVIGFDPGTYHVSIDDLRQHNQDTWRLGLNLSVPVGNRQAVSNYTSADYALSQARFDLQRLEQLARVEVRNAVRTVETNLKRVKAAQVNKRLQHEKLAAEQKKFENGMSTSFQVLQFQTDLASAESRENQAIVDYNKSLVELERVKGTLLQAKGVVVPGGKEDGKAPEAGRASAALRGLWRPAAAGPGAQAYRVAIAGPIERVTLPTTFVFDGRRLAGTGGSQDGR